MVNVILNIFNTKGFFIEYVFVIFEEGNKYKLYDKSASYFAFKI